MLADASAFEIVSFDAEEALPHAFQSSGLYLSRHGTARFPMFRALLFAFGGAIVVCVGLYWVRGQVRYLVLARRIFLAGLGAGVAFFAVLLIKRLI